MINQSQNGMCEILDRTQEMNHGSTSLSKSIKKLLECNKNVLLVVYIYIQRIRELRTKELLWSKISIIVGLQSRDVQIAAHALNKI